MKNSTGTERKIVAAAHASERRPSRPARKAGRPGKGGAAQYCAKAKEEVRSQWSEETPRAQPPYAGTCWKAASQARQYTNLKSLEQPPTGPKTAGASVLKRRENAPKSPTRGRDGLNFENFRPWTFDDGRELGSYNTQQHWVVHSDGVFLATVAEWMQPKGVEKHGSDGSVWVARIHWKRPNRAFLA